MASPHAFVKGSRARIGFNRHPNRAETSSPRRCPLKQQATHSRPQQRRLDKELQKLRIRVGDFDLSQSNDNRAALGYFNVRGCEFVGTKRQFGSVGRASNHEPFSGVCPLVREPHVDKRLGRNSE